MIGGQEEQTPKSLEDARAESVKGIGMNPEEARKRLEDLGYKEEDWTKITEQGLGSHYMRALAHIAKGSEPKDLGDVFRELFPEEHHGPSLQQMPEKILNRKNYVEVSSKKTS